MLITNTLARSSFSTLAHPLVFERLSVEAVRLSAQKRLLSYKFYNNILIGCNYAATVARYSKCYLCKLPFAKPFIRQVKGMNSLDQKINKANNLLLEELPNQLKLLRNMGKALKYPERNLHSALGLVLNDKGDVQQQVKFLAAVESVTLGFELHNSVGGSFSPNPLVRIGLALLRKVIKDKYLVLAGDYLHIRGSVLASETGSIELPKLLAETEVNLCKQVHLRDQLRQKISKTGYESVTIQEIHEIAKLRAAVTLGSLAGMAILQGEKQNLQLNQYIGLLVLYRRQIEQFIFNFPKLFNRFIEIKTGNGIFCEECTLTQYLFFQSTQKTGLRLDLAYLNTVQLISNQITILQKKIKDQIGQTKYEEFTHKLRYILIMYA